MQSSYNKNSRIHINKVSNVKNLKKPIYKGNQISYKYKVNSKQYSNNTKQNSIYIAILQIGIIKELKQQGIITADEMISIVEQLKKKNNIEVET